jgi:hypothetical protein
MSMRATIPQNKPSSSAPIIIPPLVRPQWAIARRTRSAGRLHYPINPARVFTAGRRRGGQVENLSL